MKTLKLHKIITYVSNGAVFNTSAYAVYFEEQLLEIN